MATKLITFLLVPLYTTYMSAGEYGLTDMSITVISLLTPLVTLDVAEAAVRFIVGDRARGGPLRGGRARGDGGVGGRRGGADPAAGPAGARRAGGRTRGGSSPRTLRARS